LDMADSSNAKKFHSLLLLHNLFTSSSAFNCARGNILNIPYFWHWVSPNPRHQIMHKPSGKLLKSLKPPAGFGKYQSWADVDRTPDIFISDMLTKQPLYYSESCDTFYTFGWCSEREMAISALCEMLDIPARVVAQNNHSWSDVLIPMKTKSGETKTFVFSVDNTFDSLQWNLFSENIAGWNVAEGNSKMETWYNKQAHDPQRLKSLLELYVCTEAITRIETSIVQYLNDPIY
jgi:hypothetical protein